jgi:ribosomal protein S18 acetylase RimI-like enzyme
MDNQRKVRKATTPDIPVLVALMKEFYAESSYELDEKWAADSFLNLLSNDANGCVWIVWTGNEAIGHAVLTVRFTMEHGGPSGYIDDLFVKKEFRRSGAASSVLQMLELECTKRKCKSLIVEVGKDNEAGLMTYKKLGMQKIDDGRILYGKKLA